MARINIEDSLWADPRFQDLMIKVASRHTAKGMIVELWTLAQRFWLTSGGRGIPKPAWDDAGMPSALIECNLAKDNGEFIYAVGSKEQFAWLNARSENGKKGGPAAAKSRAEIKGKSKRRKTSEVVEPTLNTSSLSSSLSSSDSNSNSDSLNLAQASASGVPTRAVLDSDGQSSGAQTWRAYKAAYQEKYQEPPSWNAKVAGQLKSFVSRIPASEAPEVAAFYLSHNDRFYVQSMHPVGLLLRDAEKLRTEWATGQRMTSAKARNSESADYAQDQLKRIQDGTL